LLITTAQISAQSPAFYLIDVKPGSGSMVGHARLRL
jgi:hypothetical protein